MKMYDTPQPVERYLNVELECDCGRTHYAPIKAINISSGALESLPGYVAEYGYAKPYILCDKITWERIFCVTKSLGRLPGNAVKNC